MDPPAGSTRHSPAALVLSTRRIIQGGRTSASGRRLPEIPKRRAAEQGTHAGFGPCAKAIGRRRRIRRSALLK